jgi:hypothetical protein
VVAGSKKGGRRKVEGISQVAPALLPMGCDGQETAACQHAGERCRTRCGLPCRRSRNPGPAHAAAGQEGRPDGLTLRVRGGGEKGGQIDSTPWERFAGQEAVSGSKGDLRFSCDCNQSRIFSLLDDLPQNFVDASLLHPNFEIMWLPWLEDDLCK